MTKEQIKAAVPVELSTDELRTAFRSGKAAREWAAENALRIEARKGGVTVRAR